MNNGAGHNYERCTMLYFADPLNDPKDRRCVQSCPINPLDIVCNCGYCGNTTDPDSDESWGATGVVSSKAGLDWIDASQARSDDPEHYTLNLLPGSAASLEEVGVNGGYCIPTGNLTESATQLLGKDDTLTDGLKDVWKHRYPIAYGCVAAFLVGFAFLYFVAWFTKPLAYAILIATCIAAFLLFIISLYEGKRVDFVFNATGIDGLISSRNLSSSRLNSIAENQTYIDILTGFWGGVWLASFVVLAAMRQRLAIAIGVVEESSRALIGMPTLLLVPVTSLIFSIMLLPVFGLGILAVVSLREWDEGVGWVYSSEVKAMLAIYAFGAIWLLTFVDAFQFTALAGAVCDWYFTMDKSKRQGGCDAATTLLRSYYRLCRYHLGTIAFGSFVVAVVKAIKYILAYISAQIQSQFPNNVMVKIIIFMVNCCVACFERLIKYLTETAYIQVAIWGRNFCSSAFYGLKLAITNMGRLAFVTILSKCLIFMGTIEISCASAAACAFFVFAMDHMPPDGYCDVEAIEHAGKGVCTEGTNTARPDWLEQRGAMTDESVADLMSASLAANETACDAIANATWHHSCTGEVFWEGPQIEGINELLMRPSVGVALILGYFIGFVFMDCYDTTIHTIIVCFCEDEKYCDGGDEATAPDDYPYYASGALEEVLGPALKFGSKKKKSGRDVANVGMDFKKQMVELKQEEEMDEKELAEAGGGKKSKHDQAKGERFEDKAKAIQKEAEQKCAEIKAAEQKELKEVAAKMKAGKAARKAKRKENSGKNVGKDAFLKQYGKALKKQGIDAEAEFAKLDADGSGDLDAEELEKFKRSATFGKAVGALDV